jgi:hypothetical protein
VETTQRSSSRVLVGPGSLPDVATWIVLAGALVLVVIVAVSLLLVLLATRQGAGPIRLPGFDRIMGRVRGDVVPPRR